MMAGVLHVLFILSFTSSLAAIQVIFNGTGLLQVNTGEWLILNCSASSDHVIHLFDIENEEIITKSKDVWLDYVPRDCTHFTNNTQCSKIFKMNVTSDMHRRFFQCYSYRRGIEHLYYYSRAGHVQVNDIMMTATAATNVTAPTQQPPELCQQTSAVSVTPSLPLIHSDDALSTPSPTLTSPQSSVVTLSPSSAGSNYLQLWTIITTLTCIVLL